MADPEAVCDGYSTALFRIARRAVDEEPEEARPAGPRGPRLRTREPACRRRARVRLARRPEPAGGCPGRTQPRRSESAGEWTGCWDPAGRRHEDPVDQPVVTVYNAERYIGEALESILSQTRPRTRSSSSTTARPTGPPAELDRLPRRHPRHLQANGGHAAALQPRLPARPAATIWPSATRTTSGSRRSSSGRPRRFRGTPRSTSHSPPPGCSATATDTGGCPTRRQPAGRDPRAAAIRPHAVSGQPCLPLVHADPPRSAGTARSLPRAPSGGRGLRVLDACAECRRRVLL